MSARLLRAVLISTYELGHQPFGLASPAAWLGATGAAVTCLDLAVQDLDEPAIAAADLLAIYVPMHTATRIAATLVGRIRALNPRGHLCFYGLYAPMNEAYLRRLGAQTILGGEFEEGLVALLHRLGAGLAAPAEQPEPAISLARQTFLLPDRQGLPGLDRYAHLTLPDGRRRTVGYTEASRGCKHLCRHCPIPPVYNGAFRVVQQNVVLADIAAQVAAGAEHITFGDPDFFNGPTHALRIVQGLHERFPDLTYDVTIKVEHLLTYARHLPILRQTGCLFITSAVEAVDDTILGIFAKGHTRADFTQAVALCRQHDLTLNPTFVTFTPWTSLQGYRDLLAVVARLQLVDHVSPIQYGIRLLIPAGSKLLDLPEVLTLVHGFDEEALCYRWSHPDPRVDRLCTDVLAAIQEGQRSGQGRIEVFRRIWALAGTAAGEADAGTTFAALEPALVAARAPVPHLSEPWYC